MIQVSIENNFAAWRMAARVFLQTETPPDEILWTDATTQNGLFENDIVPRVAEQSKEKILKVPADFLRIAEAVACFDDFEKWSLLYRLLFRLVYENRNLLAI